jgi:hypothetical protein
LYQLMLYDEAATASLQWSSEGSNRSTSPRHHSGHLVSFERNQQNQRAKPTSETNERNQRAKPTSETNERNQRAKPAVSSQQPHRLAAPPDAPGAGSKSTHSHPCAGVCLHAHPAHRYAPQEKPTNSTNRSEATVQTGQTFFDMCALK